MRRRKRQSLKAVKEINMTPLMDLTFLLLIVFMITAPVLEYETDVSPPELSTDKRIDEDQNPLLINVTEDGSIWLKKEKLALDQLQGRLEFYLRSEANAGALIRADGSLPYKRVIEVMKTVRAANITDISLVTQPES